VNGSADGLVEITIEPPCHPAPSIDTLFGLGRSRVDALVVSLDDPDGFVAVIDGDGGTGPGDQVARECQPTRGADEPGRLRRP
jgi:hypothetical protein